MLRINLLSSVWRCWFAMINVWMKLSAPSASLDGVDGVLWRRVRLPLHVLSSVTELSVLRSAFQWFTVLQQPRQCSEEECVCVCMYDIWFKESVSGQIVNDLMNAFILTILVKWSQQPLHIQSLNQIWFHAIKGKILLYTDFTSRVYNMKALSYCMINEFELNLL